LPPKMLENNNEDNRDDKCNEEEEQDITDIRIDMEELIDKDSLNSKWDSYNPPNPFYVDDDDGCNNLADEQERKDFVLDGVEWGSYNKYRRKYPETLAEALRHIDINAADKLHINSRFVKLVMKFKSKKLKWKYLSGTAKCFISIGSIVIPAMITLDDNIRERPTGSQIVAYTVFTISLLVSIVNGLHEIFSATKRYVNFAATEDSLVVEGWNFMTLSGKYNQFESHRQCVVYFNERIEKINTMASNMSYAMTKRPDDQNHTRKTNSKAGSSVDRRYDENSVGGLVVYADH
jgi:hypothetical protein